MTDYANGFRLDGKVALVTGAARGIGAEIAIALAAMGAKVLVTDVAEDGGRGTAETIVANGGMASAMRHDVTVEGEWELVIAEAVKRFGGLDVLVNNAGIETAALVSQFTVEAFRRTMDVNVTGVFLGVKHAVRAMSPGGAAGRGGSIINMSSVAGIIGTLAHTAYNTSKGAVRLLTKATAVECAQLGNGIRVNSIHPAIIATKMGATLSRTTSIWVWCRTWPQRMKKFLPCIQWDTASHATWLARRFTWPRIWRAGSMGQSW